MHLLLLWFLAHWHTEPFLCNFTYLCLCHYSKSKCLSWKMVYFRFWSVIKWVLERTQHLTTFFWLKKVGINKLNTKNCWMGKKNLLIDIKTTVLIPHCTALLTCDKYTASFADRINCMWWRAVFLHHIQMFFTVHNSFWPVKRKKIKS